MAAVRGRDFAVCSTAGRRRRQCRRRLAATPAVHGGVVSAHGATTATPASSCGSMRVLPEAARVRGRGARGRARCVLWFRVVTEAGSICGGVVMDGSKRRGAAAMAIRGSDSPDTSPRGAGAARPHGERGDCRWTAAAQHISALAGGARGRRTGAPERGRTARRRKPTYVDGDLTVDTALRRGIMLSKVRSTSAAG